MTQALKKKPKVTKATKKITPITARTIDDRIIDRIFVKNAKEHNLKGIDVALPRNSLCVVTGLSGSGKSSLAFDTIYAEGQRRYVESLSAYARQFLDRMQKPDVEYIEGLSPAISIEQRNASSNPRSTVGTTTEIYDYLRLLFASIGIPHDPKTGEEIKSQSAQEIVEHIYELEAQSKLLVLAPIIEGRKGEHKAVFEEALKQGFVRARVNGAITDLADKITLDKKKKHTIEIVVDRLVLKPESRKRLTDSVESALKAGHGIIKLAAELPKGKVKELKFSEHFSTADGTVAFEKLEPRMFSFNSPYGACLQCDGLGNRMDVDPKLVISDPSKALKSSIDPWRRGGKSYVIFLRRQLRKLATRHGFSVDTPYKDLTKKQQDLVLYGEPDSDDDFYNSFEGVIPNLERRFKETESEFMKNVINKYMSEQNCPGCHGKRLNSMSLYVTVAKHNIMQICNLSIEKAVDFFEKLTLNKQQEQIARQVLKEVRQRLDFLKNVGLGYLTLSRMSGTLSGGEAQRIRLATQIGAGLMGVLYVLDEPSIGLHQKDNQKLLDTMRRLRDLGNTLIVVEHDDETMLASDYIIDMGPGAGEHGGHVVAFGKPAEVMANTNSLTGDYLSGRKKIAVPTERRNYKKSKKIKVHGAAEHNLKSVNAEFPLGNLICVTGVSGSGKSTLIDDILYRGVMKYLHKSKDRVGAHKKITGLEYIDKVIEIDQSPIGRTPRSNPATYTGLWGPVRELYSKLPDARVRGFKPGRFSFNVKGGRCESCEGDGVKKIEMHFLPDVYVTCEICKGSRFNQQTLEIKHKGFSIADVLGMSVEEALLAFDRVPAIKTKLETLHQVGLDYIKLGQSSTTLSGGEAQRVKLSSELSKRATGKTLYILDEPTTGLHFEDIAKLLQVLQSLTDKGNTIVVIEHNLDVIKTADYVIDLGPGGGDGGGMIVATGSPEEIAQNKKSFTGHYLKKVL
ncbi:MAG: excinuclease ABC subunit A [Candidatus Omnitrophota bacterium]|jgi:excinuclease ABC subunit A